MVVGHFVASEPGHTTQNEDGVLGGARWNKDRSTGCS
jgi:hypothetical protein